MDEKRVCDGCGGRYWPNQAWIHEGCGVRLDGAEEKAQAVVLDEGVSGGSDDRNGVLDGEGGDKAESLATMKQRWSRESYNAYQREYMRKRRAK